MMKQMLLLILASLVIGVLSQIDLEKHFKDCRSTEETFDECLKNGLNDLRPYFITGIKKYGVDCFDPFFVTQVTQKMNAPLFQYKLVLRNVTESGWTASEITKLKTDFVKNNLQYSQYFPDKRLHGLYEIDGMILGNKVSNQGAWNLKLGDYRQTTTVTRKVKRDANGKVARSPTYDVIIKADTCDKLEMHIGNLAGGRTVVENMLDRVINTAWQPGFLVLRPLINDLVSTAFTEIFNKNFQNFPFSKVFPN